jgi:hypothetical protein
MVVVRSAIYATCLSAERLIQAEHNRWVQRDQEVLCTLYFVCRCRHDLGPLQEAHCAERRVFVRRNASSRYCVFRLGLRADTFRDRIEKQILLLLVARKQRPHAVGHFRIDIEKVFLRQIPQRSRIARGLGRI